MLLPSQYVSSISHCRRDDGGEGVRSGPRHTRTTHTHLDTARPPRGSTSTARSSVGRARRSCTSATPHHHRGRLHLHLRLRLPAAAPCRRRPRHPHSRPPTPVARRTPPRGTRRVDRISEARASRATAASPPRPAVGPGSRPRRTARRWASCGEWRRWREYVRELAGARPTLQARADGESSDTTVLWCVHGR